MCMRAIASVSVRSLFNASVAVYDPYRDTIVDILMFSGITHNPSLHIGGVQVDPHTKLVSIVVDAAAPFNTGGQVVSGDNFIIKYDAAQKRALWNKNITTVSKGEYAGFQDVEHDARGNTYIVGSFPGTILKVDREGSAVVPWYLPAKIDHTKFGFSGLAAAGDVLLSNNNEDSQIYRFDMKAEKGNPLLVARSPNTTLARTDAIYLPPRYDGRVLLVAENTKGITVLRSSDGSWQSAEYLGTVPNNSSAAQGGTVTAAVQIGKKLYMVEEFFADPPVSGSTAGNRKHFPMVDITLQVEQLLKK
ncbi:core trichothecene cluster (CTC) protein 14 [Colletotrichum spaethianum]|uniref:Core trichothecene cluster (CTC) protein 14 n=1 Tax=Colletotrichum spaethianum TaxID=700344 RepID=A0AA37NYR4_9PEZI|nr:core trichothecene cluster (CTC) protein 14 [Colletotrichum spaethianum]GKT41423.1 core trichothecene cluster (CTC) protein 14 [Colletotrichum spaethianum]